MENYPRDHPGWYRDTLAELFDLAAQGAFDPHISSRFPLSEASRAHRLLEEEQVAGKLVLVARA